jgi:small subunit ribosomal protein S16
VAVKIRLKRMGKIHAPYYRIVVADARTKRDGRAIEEIGIYHPTEHPSVIEVNSERALYWLGVGAQPTEQVEALLKLTGDWGKFKGDKNAKSTVKFAEPKPEFFADAKKKPVLRPKALKPVVEETPVAEAPAVVEETPVAEAPTPDAPTSDAVAEVAPIEDAPVADTATEVPVEASAAEETPSEDVAAEEVPAEPVAEPVADPVAEEAPAEEVVADEASDETKPAN